MKRKPTDQTSPDHHLTSLTARKNTKWKELSHTDSPDDQNNSNTSSSGRDIPKATTHGSQLIKYMPLNLSSIINPQSIISHLQLTINHPQPIISQPQE